MILDPRQQIVKMEEGLPNEKVIAGPASDEQKYAVLKKKEYLFAYLNTVAEELARTRHTQTALAKISQLIVPQFANWFSIDLLKNNRLEELILAHEDPDMVHWARQYRVAYPVDLNRESSTARVARTGEPSFIPLITEDMILSSIHDQQQRESVLKLNLQSVITVALFGRETIIGIISFVSSATGRHFDETDLRFAQNLANHIGLALENARLNEAAEKEITERRRIEQQLADTQAQLHSALSSGLVGTWKFDIANNLLYPDENLSRMFGIEYPASGCDRELLKRKVHPDDVALVDQRRNNSIDIGGIYETEYRVVHEGVTRWVFARGQTMPNLAGQPNWFTGVVIDITERKKAELALKESNELFRFLADVIPHKMWTSAPDGTATYYNQGWYDYTGTNSFDELKARIWDMLHPDDRKTALVSWPKAIAQGEQTEMESRFRRSDGEYRWHLTRIAPHRNEEGNIQLWVGTSTDIHEHKVLHEALQKSEAHFKALTQNNSLPIWRVNARGELIFVNNAWCTFTGIAAEQISDSNWSDHIHPEDRESVLSSIYSAFSKKEPLRLQYRFLHAPTGEHHWMLDDAQPVFNPAFDGYIGTMTDIQEQEESRLAMQELMSKKDEFISIASHELRTPLTSIKAFNQLILRTRDGHKLSEFGRKLTANVIRLEKLISDLLDVTKINAGQITYDMETFNFCEMLANSIESARHMAPDYLIELENCPEMDYTGDPYRLEQVVQNLISNAVKYSPVNKRILIKAKVEQQSLVVSVQDFGIGIAEDQVDLIFDRYYRVDNTAMRFDGLGLGLFICSEILKRHHGRFWIESQLGQGATFYFSLPLPVN